MCDPLTLTFEEKLRYIGLLEKEIEHKTSEIRKLQRTIAKLRGSLPTTPEHCQTEPGASSTRNVECVVREQDASLHPVRERKKRNVSRGSAEPILIEDPARLPGLPPNRAVRIELDSRLRE